ncbi:putative Ser/Thr protein kinase [Streptosporangium becharense]|uniref:Putative Ser/Thr protein kinase n=1 Tax=Streptosporangium becharense TaxID=1816182 RepID=A0A7W9MGX4_9ACTN|nr:serine/threonine-protein kinase [Streptosporangium becharense]MBB2909128.1 putative Ser/Thr protein kinase [Streptosporangium becharense]MBB5819853.1 putative Ser/Thr protein kinase [Streptosporangium becharense]
MSHQYGPAWHPQRPPQSNTAGSIVWALVPLFTCGFGTPFIIGHAAYRLRSPALVLVTALYTAGIGIFTVAAGTYGDSDLIPVGLNVVSTVGFFGSWLGGVVHALVLRGSVFEQPQHTQASFPAPSHGSHQAASYSTGPVAPDRHAPAHYGPSQHHGGASPGPGPHHGPHHDAPAPYASASQPPHNTHPPYGTQSPHNTQPPYGTQPPHNTQPPYGAQGPATMVGRRGQHVPSSPSPEPQGWLGPYQLIGSLGKGGQGTVHLALNPQGQKVAIKVLHDHLTGDPAVRERFLREVEATRKVATFSTARVLDVNITDDQAYIVSEYVDGVSLERLVREKGPRDEDGLTRLALATAGALAAIHRAGVVHRDFKPANVLIGTDGPRVIDFGIARALGQVTATASIMGTPAYMSPEQLAGGTVGPESDVFSWAATMIFAASGRVAFGDDTIPAILNRVINHQPDLSALPPSLRPLAAACLDKEPGNRPKASDIMLQIVN